MEGTRMEEVRRVIVGPNVMDVTMKALRIYGRRRLEGLVLWLGNIESNQAFVTRVVVPDQQPVASESGLGYFVTGETLFQLNKTLAETGLRLIAQVHSHPTDAYHSATDDRYAIVTADGGFSLVVPNFGDAPADPATWAVYRLNGSDWLELSSEDVTNVFQVGEL